MPLPSPFFDTVSVSWGAKLAVTERAMSIVTVQVDCFPVQAPDHSVNAEPEAAVAVSVTEVPVGNGVEQTDPQSIPMGSLVTVPAPPPASVTVSRWSGPLKLASTDTFAFTCTTQGPVPVQAPAQPVKVESMPAVAVRVTEVPCAYWALQVEPQLIPAGTLLIVPRPFPGLLTVSVLRGTKIALTERAALIV